MENVIYNIEENTEEQKNNSIPSLSFNASGWLYIFQLGVIDVIRERSDIQYFRAYGTSAGASAGAVLVLGLSSTLVAEEICKQELQTRSDFKKMVSLMKNGIERLTPIDAYKCLNNLLHINCTEFDYNSPFCFKNVQFNKFSTSNDVIELLSATAHIPILGGYKPYIYKGHILYDGLFTNSHPLNDNHTCFKISWTNKCSCCCTDVINNPRVFSPNVDFPTRWCFLPPDNKTLRLIYWHGYCESAALIERPDFPSNELKIKPRISNINNIRSPEDVNYQINQICNTPINLITDEMKESILCYSDNISIELKKRIDISNEKWRGCIGCIRYAIITASIIFPCCPLKRIVQPLVLSGRFNHVTEYNKIKTI
tara:strand:+ start:3659 stop:4765 length:1107 start_codon:yes stop_codon:yes gene_type:complete